MSRRHSEHEDSRDLEGTHDSQSPLNFWQRNMKKLIGAATTAIVAAPFALTAVYSIPINSEGVVQKFGAYSRTEQPGMHLKFPWPIETVTSVPVQAIQMEEFGFRTDQKEEDRVQAGKKFQKEYLMLTGDLNMADIESAVSWRVSDSKKFLFNVAEPRELIRSAYASVIREVIGNGSVDEALMLRRTEYGAQAKVKLQQILDSHQAGITITLVNLQSTHPPERVRGAFNAVNEAIQFKERRINEARQQYNSQVPKAQGQAEKLVSQAEAFAMDRVNTTKAAVAQFSGIAEMYGVAPDVISTRLYFEALSQYLANPTNRTWIVEQKGIEGGLLFKLDLDEKSKPEAVKK